MDSNHFTIFNTNVIDKDVLEELLTPTPQPPGLSVLQSSEESKVKHPPEVIKKECLSSKNAVKFLLDGTLKRKVCRYCLNVTSPLSELDQVLQVAGQGVWYKVTIREMIASFHSCKVVDDPNFPNKICNKCLDHTLTSYLFNQQCERSERALRNCFEDMYDKLEKLDPLERTKKRGRQKLNFNHNVLYADHEKVIDYAEPLITIVNIGTEPTAQKSNNQDSQAFICSKCCQELPNFESLLNHEKSHPKSMLYHCHLCGKSFVKRFHLKKHIQSAHSPIKQLDTQNTDFKCQDCGTVTSDYQAHLQHIEKHKFKTVLHHLVTRKMDKLCAICLNSGSKLADLEKIVCLHGGYPELMGERTLYSIVGSTVPAKSPSYKYQELHVPSEARILSIVKLIKSTEDNKTNRFNISLPVVISKDIINCKSPHMYIFESPDFLQIHTVEVSDVEDEVMSGDENSMSTTIVLNENDNMGLNLNNINASNKQQSLYDYLYGKHFASVDKPVSTFTKTQYSGMNDKSENTNFGFQSVLENTERAANACKTCWIFKNPTCRDCCNTSNSNQFQNEGCPSCWLFKNCKECGFCKKPMTYDVECNIETDLESCSLGIDVGKQSSINLMKRKNNIESLEQNDNKEVNSNALVKKRKIVEVADHLDKEMQGKRKRKDNVSTKRKKSKWQCQICLTTNADRELCVCCDSPHTLKDIKYNFQFNKDFFNTLNKNTEKCNKESLEVISDPDIDEGAVGNTMSNKEIFAHIEKPESEIMKIEPQIINEKYYVINQTPENTAYNCYYGNQNHVTVGNTENVTTELDVSEEMDTAMETPQVEESMINRIFLNPLARMSQWLQSPQLPQFQFHLGTAVAAPNKPARKKRPSRKC